jgi:hypothetical protein
LITASFIVGITISGVVRAESHLGTAGTTASLRQLATELQREVADLRTTVHNQSAEINTLQSQFEAQQRSSEGLRNTIREHNGKLKFVTVKGTEIYITGANLNIRDGSGATSGTTGSPYVASPTGLGNLIIGYNENGIPPCPGCLPQPSRLRTGSHNLVLGVDNGYTSIAGFVVGFANTISSPYATISGGAYSAADGMFSAISGGEGTAVSAEGSAISGGLGGKAIGRWSSVTGGSENTASNESASVCGGSANTANGLFSSVTGGTGNTVNGQSSSISGGGSVTVNDQFSWAAGGLVWP